MKKLFYTFEILFFLIFSNISYSAKIINFKKEFNVFWNESKNSNFKEKEKSWNENIESIDPIFFKENVWEKDKNETLKKLFVFYSKIDINKYLNMYDEYEKTVAEVLKKYEKKAPDYRGNINIMIAPGITWGGSYIKNLNNKKEYLALGIDKGFEIISKNKSFKIEPLIIHEIFHHYHGTVQGNTVDKSYENYLNKGKLFWQLWDEGIAVWGTGYIGENENLSYILFGNKNYNPSKDKYYAKLFLKEMDNSAIDLKNPINVKKWFGSNVKDNPLGKDTPPMIGYYLGWRVVKGIEKKGIDRKIFMKWNYEEAKPYIIEQLKIISSS